MQNRVEKRLAFVAPRNMIAAMASAVVLMAVAADLTGAPKVLMLMPERSLDAEFFIQKEAKVMIDVLGQAGYAVVVSTVDGKAFGTERTQLHADLKTSDVQLDDYAAVVVPCMGAGDHPATKDNVALLKKANARGIIIAAQNATEVLAPAGIILDHKIAWGPGVIIDGNLITSYNCPYTARGNGKPVDTQELIGNLLKMMHRIE